MIQSDAIFPTSGEGVSEGRGVDQILGWKEGVKAYLLGSNDAMYNLNAIIIRVAESIMYCMSRTPRMMMI